MLSEEENAAFRDVIAEVIGRGMTAKDLAEAVQLWILSNVIDGQ